MADEESTQETKPHQVPDDLGEPGASDEASETQAENGGEKRKFFKRRSREREGTVPEQSEGTVPSEPPSEPSEEEVPQAGYEPAQQSEPEPEREPEPEPEPEPVAEVPEIKTEDLAEAAPEPEVVETAGAAAAASAEPPRESPAGADERSQTPAWAADLPDSKAVERPELFVAGAFVGGFVFAKLLKKLGGED